MTPDALRFFTLTLICFLVIGAGLLCVSACMLSSRISRLDEVAGQSRDDDGQRDYARIWREARK